MTDNALLASLIMDKFRHTATGGAKRATRRRAAKGTRTRGRGKGRRVSKKSKLVKLPSGLFIRMPKKGYMATPSGRFVRDTAANHAKYYPEIVYEPGATDVQMPQ